MWKSAALTEDERKQHFVRRRAQTMFQAALRRDRDQVLLHDDTYQRGMSKRFHFGLALKECDEPQKFKKELYSTLKREYAIRYLEAIGATPTPKMIKLIQEKQPLKEEMVSAAWKSRGSLDDRLYIAPHFHKPPEQEEMLKDARSKAKSLNKGGGETVSIMGFNDKNVKKSEKRVTIGGVVQGVGDEAVHIEYDVPPVDPEEAAFDLLKRKYIYPFNTPANPKFNNTTEDEAGEDEGELTNGIHKKNNSRTDAEQMLYELKTPLETTMTQVKLMQKRFLNTFQFSRLQHKMKDGEFKKLTEIIISNDMKRLIGLISHYLYFTSFRKITGIEHMTKALSKDKMQATYTAIVKCFSNIEKAVTTSVYDRMLMMSLIMLSLRIAIEMIYRAAFPGWFTFENFVTLNFWSGASTLPKRDEVPVKTKKIFTIGNSHSQEGFNPMDPRLIEVILETMHVGPLGASLTVLNSVVTDILDSKQYYGRISSLESTGEGIRILSQANKLRSRAAARPDTSDVSRARSPSSSSRDKKDDNTKKDNRNLFQHPAPASKNSQGSRKKKNSSINRRDRASTAPTSPDMMLGGRFHSHVLEMDDLRTRQVSTRSSASTRSAGYATSGLVQSVFSSPRAPRARQILSRGNDRRDNSYKERSVKKRIGSPTNLYNKKKLINDNWENELKRRSENSKASRRHTARETRRPALTAAGKAFLHEIALDRVKTRYTSGPKSSSKTLRMRMLSDIGV
jgi:hypothetical protein